MASRTQDSVDGSVPSLLRQRPKFATGTEKKKRSSISMSLFYAPGSYDLADSVAQLAFACSTMNFARPHLLTTLENVGRQRELHGCSSSAGGLGARLTLCGRAIACTESFNPNTAPSIALSHAKQCALPGCVEHTSTSEIHSDTEKR